MQELIKIPHADIEAKLELGLIYQVCFYPN
jgi:hypothetical protein